MQISPTHKRILSTLALLSCTLACRAATSLVFPDTPTPAPSPTQTPMPTPPPTQTPVYEAACPVLLTDIMDAAFDEPKSSEGFNEEGYYVLYTIENDKLDTRDDVTANNSIGAQYDLRERHEFIWNYFADLIPQAERNFVTEFAVTSDGQGEILAAVSPNNDNPSQWTLEVDTIDADDNYNLTFTLVHEFGHLLSLNSNQVPVNRRVFYNADDLELYDQAVAECPQYFTGEGCSNSDSYINEFFNRFWPHLYEEWQEIDSIEDDDEYYERLDDFYHVHQDQFLTDYAPTSPQEDIAESWSFFILSPRPQQSTIADEKILFFYEYPELVQLRETILNRLCEAFPQ